MTNKATKQMRKLIMQTNEHPDWCFENHPRYLTDLYLYTIASDHPIYGLQYGNVRMCSTCGKNYNDAPALA
jgi:hypothetical protein